MPHNRNMPLLAVIARSVGVRTGSLIPYIQAKLIAKDDTEFVLAFGLRF